MINFIGVLNSSNRVVEHNRIGASLPDSNETVTYIQVTEEINNQIRLKHQELARENRIPEVFYTAGNGVFTNPDTRPIFNVTITTNNPDVLYAPTREMIDYIKADGIDTATVTTTAVDAQGNTLPFTGVRATELFNGRVALLNYVNGVAVNTFTSNESGLFTLSSTKDHRLIGEAKLLCVEV